MELIIRMYWWKGVVLAAFIAGPTINGVCRCTPTNEQTAWGGHMAIRDSESKAISGVRGIVQTPSGEPLDDALVEVYDHPEILDRDPMPRRKGQKRIVGCKTDKSGTFSLRVPPGRYEVRFSKALDWDVTSVTVLVRKTAPFTTKRIIVKLHPGD